MNFGWLTGFMTPAAREHVPEHSGQADSARGQPPPSSWPDLIWPPRMLTADADDLGHSSNWSRSATCLHRSIRPPWPILDGQDPARVRGFVPVACPIRRSTPGTCGHSRLARHPARKAKACRSWRLHRCSPGGLPGHTEGLSERGPLRRSCPAGSIDRAHQASSSLTGAAPRLPARRPAHRRDHHRARVRASHSGKLHRNRRGETLASCRQPESLNPGSAPGSTETAPRSRGCPLATLPDRRTRPRPAPALTTSRR